VTSHDHDYRFLHVTFEVSVTTIFMLRAERTFYAYLYELSTHVRTQVTAGIATFYRMAERSKNFTRAFNFSPRLLLSSVLGSSFLKGARQGSCFELE